MAQDSVRTMDEFIKRFPSGETATASFTAADWNQQIGFQVKQPNGRLLTFVQRTSRQPHGALKRQAETLVAKLDKAGLAHEPLIDETP